jgi:hypothetical protein
MRILILSLLLFLSGCAALAGPVLMAAPSADAASKTFDYTTDKIDKILGTGDVPVAERDRVPFAVYCYRTRGEVDCFSRPLPGNEARLIGVGSAKTLPVDRAPFILQTLEEPEKAPPPPKKKIKAPKPNVKPIAPPDPNAKIDGPVQIIIGDKVYGEKELPSSEQLKAQEQKGYDELRKSGSGEWLGKSVDEVTSPYAPPAKAKQ